MKLPMRIAVSIGAAVIGAFIVSTSFLEDLDIRLSDQILRVRGKQRPPAKVIVVAIDETSYRELNVPFGPPWPRALHAQLLNRLKKFAAKRAVFDVLFMGEGSDKAADVALASALKELPTVIGVEAAVRHVSNQAGGYELEEIELPFEPFRKSAKLALVGLRDMNGVIRNFPFARSDQEARYPFLAEAAAGRGGQDPSPKPGPRDFIRYYGPGRTVPIISYWEVLQDELPIDPELFEDAIVFVGILLRSDTGAAQKDSYQTPFGGSMMYGVEVHATIVNNLLTEGWISRPSRPVELIGQALLIGALAFLGTTITPIALSIATISLIITWLVLAFWGLSAGFFLCGGSTVLIVAPTILLASTGYSYLSARQSEQSLKSAFSLYLSPEMLPDLQREKDGLKLGGEKLWLTALFTDIADFTSITEEMPAEKTSEMLNAYFTEVMEVVFQNQGTLIKFIGDAVFAIWGAPIKIANHAEMAVKTGLAIQKEVTKFNATQRFPALITRIGINTGPMVVGNLGSKRRFDYTAIGDSVNLAARLEGLNKYFGTTLIFSESTRKDAGGFSGAVEIGKVRVKGKREAVQLFTMFDPPLAPTVLESWNRAYEDFSQLRLESAEAAYQRVQSEEPRLKKACSLYLGEIQRLGTALPPQGWSGELDFDSK